ncbi:MAG: hypothetical protein B7Y41_04580 [Hydrogenophilales bacterium 28-61-23]|nr:MAG: hypothetical protein B7Y41_04580 [Hydrogenophilales bacterium 28-61-23]
MKKSLIALAVAGVVSAPAFAATSNVDVYGVMNIAVETNDTNATYGSEPAIVNNTSRIGFKGSEDLGGGMKAIWQIESGLGTDHKSVGVSSTAGQVDLATRNTFVGLAGGFGTVLMGRHDTPYKLGTGSLDLFADTIGDYNQAAVDAVDALDATHDARAASALAYISPTFSGFHFAAAMVLENGFTGGGLNKADENMDAVSLTGIYSNGPLFASLSYQNVEVLDSDAWKLGVGYTMGDAKVGFIYEAVGNYGGAVNLDRNSWQVNGAYNMGPIVLKASYAAVDRDLTATTSADETKWVVGVDYNLSKRTTAYLVHVSADNDSIATTSDGATGLNIGIKHSF